MKLSRFVSLIFLFGLSQSALSTECGKPISVEAVVKLIGPITLGGLTAKFGEWCQGHGPVSTYKDTSGNEIWFFWKASGQSATNDGDRIKYQVLLASVVPADDPGEYKIIWPLEFVGTEIRDVLAKEYDSQTTQH